MLIAGFDVPRTGGVLSEYLRLNAMPPMQTTFCDFGRIYPLPAKSPLSMSCEICTAIVDLARFKSVAILA